MNPEIVSPGSWIDVWGPALLGAVLGAVVGVFCTLLAVRAKRKDDHLSAQWERLNRQLRELYAPLYNLNEDGERVWRAFLETHSDDKRPLEFRRFFPVAGMYDPELTQDDLSAYRLYMDSLFMPTNLAMAQTIINHGDLLLGGHMPESFRDFCLHVDSTKPLMAFWEQANERGRPIELWEHMPSAGHPLEFAWRVRATYEVLWREQERILARRLRKINEAALAEDVEEAVKTYMRGWAARRRVLAAYEADRDLPLPTEEKVKLYGPYYTGASEEDLQAARKQLIPELDKLWGINTQDTGIPPDRAG